MSETTFRSVWIADLHVGSRWAVANPAETPKHCPGKEVQKKLFEKYAEAAAGPGHRPDALVLLGDAVDGQNRKSAGSDSWTTDIDEQVQHAADLVRMWDPKEIYVIGGSKYHVAVGDTGVSAEEMLAQALKAAYYPNQDHLPETRRRRSGPHWFLTFGNVTVHAAHHVSIARVFHYMSTPIAREMMQAKLNDPMRGRWETLYRTALREPRAELLRTVGLWKTQIVMRGHAHHFWACDAGGSLGIIVPGWKTPDAFIAERDPLGFSHIGYVTLTFEGTRWQYQKHLYAVEDLRAPPHTVVGAGAKAAKGRRPRK